MKRRIIRKNKKRIDPRYFLYEQLEDEGGVEGYDEDASEGDDEGGESDKLIFSLAQLVAGDICRNALEVSNALRALRDHRPQCPPNKAECDVEESKDQYYKYIWDTEKMTDELKGTDTPKDADEVAWSFINQNVRHIERMHRESDVIDQDHLSQKVKELAMCPEGDRRFRSHDAWVESHGGQAEKF